MTNRSLQEIRRRSAGIMSPAASLHHVAGHELAQGHFAGLAVAQTVAVTLIMALSLAAAASARTLARSAARRPGTP